MKITMRDHESEDGDVRILLRSGHGEVSTGLYLNTRRQVADTMAHKICRWWNAPTSHAAQVHRNHFLMMLNLNHPGRNTSDWHISIGMRQFDRRRFP